MPRFLKRNGKVNEKRIIQPKNQFAGYSVGQTRPFYSWTFNGEKNLGEIGPIKSYVLDYEALRLRSWQSYLESELTKTIISKRIRWIVGKGLKLQSEPDTDLLKQEGITLDARIFSKAIEARWRTWAASKHSDYSKMRNFNYIQKKALLNAIVGGDVLVILRLSETNDVNVQLVDGSHVMSPRYGNEWYPQYLPNGDRIVNGVECTSTNEHVAYHVRVPGLFFLTERVPCKSNDGLTIAFLLYGSEYRIDNMRGIPLATVVLETLKKLERYKEATLGSAEERAKIVYQIVHKEYSTGESPLTKQMVKAHDIDTPINDNLPSDQEGHQLANDITVSTNKQTFNLTQGAEIKPMADTKQELHFKDFYDKNIDIVCAALDIPPDVAMSKYNENYSASRAAIKDWEHTLQIDRGDLGDQFINPVYAMYLHVEVLKNKISAPGYLIAFYKKNWYVLEAYLKSRYIGAPVPHIDPVKEVQAIREKLGNTGESLPLISLEQATEEINGGDSVHNMEQYADELKKSKELGIEPVIEPPNQSLGGSRNSGG